MNGCMANACATSSLLAGAAADAATPATAKSPACPSKKSSSAMLRARAVSCRATRNDSDLLWLPRREILSGIGGVAAGLVGYQSFVSAANSAEVKEEEVPSCDKGDPVTDQLIECTDPTIPCPPTRKVPVVDFKPELKVKRIRRPVHLLSREYQEKYKEAIGKMKALPASNPLSFVAQAAIHEAYCDGHYQYDPENKNVPFDVHFSWIFAPWHRMYIYFYEKALGQLIGDDTFALPFWNWDTPAGMVVPALFKDSFANPLYDRNRDQDLLDKIVNLDFLKDKTTPVNFNGPRDKAYQEAIYKNLCIVHQQQIRGGGCARSFLGEKLCTKVKQGTSSQGSLERMAHTALHVWVGRKDKTCTGGVVGHDGATTCANDMGFLGSAGRDPLFYSHHANVDRMWHLWSKLGGQGFKDPEWLDATFVFYDNVENPRPVKIKFSDVLDTENLGYTYDAESDKDLPWKDCSLTSLVPHTPQGAVNKLKSVVTKATVFPVTLKKGEVVEVPAVAVPKKKDGQQRVLLIQGIEFDPSIANKFDVAINVPKGSALEVGPNNFEFAGSFAVVPSSVAGGGNLTGGCTLSIEECLNDIKATDDSTVDIIIVPRSEGEIKITTAPKILT